MMTRSAVPALDHRAPPGNPGTTRRLLSLAALLATSATAAAVDCALNVHEAYQAAKLNGWQFHCIPGVGVAGGFVVYPGGSIGCTFRTPPLPSGARGDAQFFETNTTGTHFKNGWQLFLFEFSGAAWIPLKHSTARVVGQAGGLGQFNKTYNFRLDKLVLRKAGGTCAKAIDEAF